MIGHASPQPPARPPDARAIAADVAAGRRSCTEVACEALARLEATRDLNTFITVNPRLLEDAGALDAERRVGRTGPLHGVPVAIKDNIETRDMPTTAGAAAFALLRTGRDAEVVARLRRAGALVLGKANLDELAIAGHGLSWHGGQMLSPHDPARHPAGSSGGSAVALATGAAALALGTETVNSLRYPASATGTVAIRPAVGTLDRRGVFPQSALCDVVGPMTRGVADAVLLLDALRGGAGSDAPAPLDPAGVRIGVPRAMFGRGPEHAGVDAAIEAALARLEGAGAAVIEIDDPTLATAPLYDRLAVQVYEVAALFEDYMAELAALPGATGLGGVRTLRDVLDRGPHAPLVPPFVERALAGSSDDRARAIEERARARAARETERALRAHFERERLDAIAYPLCHRPAARPIGEPSRPERNGILASALGWPAIDLPVGVAREDGAAAPLPIGLNLAATPERERDLLALALTVERAAR